MDDNSLLVAFHHLRREITLSATAQLQTMGLAIKQGSALSFLHEHKKLSLSELSQFIQSDAGATSRTIQSLEKLDYVKRQTDPGDGRSFLISLTPKGRTKAKQVVKAFDSLQKQADEILNASEMSRLIKLMNKLSQGLHDTRG